VENLKQQKEEDLKQLKKQNAIIKNKQKQEETNANANKQ
jgi:3-methyladenine DNA glycosylase Tag